jgi:preprotein translocase subunit SecF
MSNEAVWLIVSFAVMVVAVLATLYVTGGTLLEVRLAQPASTGAIRSRLTAAGLGDSVIQIFDDPRDVLIRTVHTPTRRS